MSHSLVYLVFFVSGAAGLLFETLWFRQANLALGSTVWASCIVLSSFMAGLATGQGLAARLGTRIRRPLAWYAGLELTVAVSGVLIAVGLPWLGAILVPVFQPLLDSPALLNVLRLSVAFVILLAPATAMGATLPTLTKALHQGDPHFGGVLGRLYGCNTLGAVVGALAGEMLLIEAIGVRGSALFAGGLALCAAGGAGLLARSLPAPEAETQPGLPTPAPTPLGPRARRLLAAAFFCGASLLALEVLWFRFLALWLDASARCFADLLAIVLLGIAAGGLLASTWLRRRPGASNWLSTLTLATGATATIGYALFDPLPSLQASVSASSGAYLDVALGLRLVFPVCVASGVLFTLQGAAFHAELGEGQGREPRAAGLISMANTTGGIVGAAGAGFAVLPWVGLEGGLFGVGVLYALAGALQLQPSTLDRFGRALLATLTVTLAMGLIFFPFGSLVTRFVPVARTYVMVEGSEQVAFREGVNATVRCLQWDFLGQRHRLRLVSNGYSMSGDGVGSRRYMKQYVYLPAAVHPKLERALLIAYGVGQTAKALTDTSSLTRIDVVDPGREILGMSPVVYPDPSDDPLKDPRVRVHLEDGRFYLQSTQQEYDLITGEPPPPKVAGMVNLYTQEYFQLIRDRLAEGGICTYWLPGASLNGEDSRAILKAFSIVFADATLWHGWGLNLMMVGTRPSASTRPVSESHFRAQWASPVVADELALLGYERAEQLGATLLADTPTLQTLLADTLPLTDDRPYRLTPGGVSYQDASEGLAAFMDEARAREDFANSDWVRAHWPEGLREGTLEWFEAQRILRRTRGALSAGERLAALHYVLSETDLQTLPLWLLDSDGLFQRILVSTRGAAGAEVALHQAAGAFAGRDYRRAGQILRSTPFRILGAYAGCMAGDPLPTPPAGGEDEAEAWAWLKQTFGG